MYYIKICRPNREVSIYESEGVTLKQQKDIGQMFEMTKVAVGFKKKLYKDNEVMVEM